MSDHGNSRLITEETVTVMGHSVHTPSWQMSVVSVMSLQQDGAKEAAGKPVGREGWRLRAPTPGLSEGPGGWRAAVPGAAKTQARLRE